MSDAKNTILDLDSIMDVDMGKVETMPDYVNLSKGVYVLKCTKAEPYKKEAQGEKAARAGFRITYELVDTKECEDLAFPNGSLISENFTATEQGLQFFKKRAMNLLNVSSLDGASLKDVLDSMIGVEATAVVTIRKTKAENGNEYENASYRFLHESQPS